MQRLDKDEKAKFNLGLSGGNTNCVNEYGLYSLILASRKPEAKKFKRWVTHDVLPTIRKTGGYVNNADLFVDTYLGELSDDQKIIVKSCMQSIEEQKKKINNLENENNLLSQETLEWADRPLINSIIRRYSNCLGGNFAKAWVNFKKELLYKHSINLNTRITAYLNETGKKTKPKTLQMLDDSELPCAVSTAVALCRENNVDISDIIQKRAG